MIDRISKEIKKYIKTWDMLLFHCDQFVAIPLEQRKQTFTRPVLFLSVSLLLLGLIGNVFGYWLASVMNSDYSISLRTIASQIRDPTDLILQIIGIGLQAALWYSVAHKGLGHPFAVRTPFPLRRIFTELLYINTPIIAVTTLWFTVGVVIFGQLVIYVFLPSVPVLRHLPAPIASIILLLFLALAVVLVVGGLVIPAPYYSTKVMTRLLKIEWGWALVLSVVIFFLASLPTWGYRMARTQTIPQFLSDKEVEAARQSRAIASAEQYYWEKHGSVLPIPKLTEYIEHLPIDDGWRLKHANQYSRVIGLADGTDEGYRFSMEVRRRAGIAFAVPETLAGMTRHVIMTDIESGITYVKDELGPSENPLNDAKHLVPIGLGDN